MKKVLIVDDAAFMRLAIRNMITKHGFEVADEAENGIIAIKKYLECKPDVVTMDITMPDMGGLDALKNLMKLDAKAKVVMVSAMGQEDMVRECIMSGAKSFIVKPFKEEHVVQTLKKVAGIE